VCVHVCVCECVSERVCVCVKTDKDGECKRPVKWCKHKKFQRQLLNDKSFGSESDYFLKSTGPTQKCLE